jgi:2'-5' RNA ligase
VTNPTRLTPLSNPENVLFEEVEERPGLTEAEAYALLVGADTNTFGVPKITVAAAEVHTGAMIALVPGEADLRRLAVAGGESRGQLHVTLVYLGEVDDISTNARSRLVERLEATLEGRGPVVGEGFAVSVFNPPGHIKEDGKDRDSCIVLGLSGRELEQIHTTVESVVRDVQDAAPGLVVPEQHTPWIPHLTLVYTDDVRRIVELTDRTGPVTFDRVRLAFGDDVHDVPLVS